MPAKNVINLRVKYHRKGVPMIGNTTASQHPMESEDEDGKVKDRRSLRFKGADDNQAIGAMV